MSKYLYGAAVQGIQGFILQTNKLREIVGASEMVAQICENKFAEILGNKLKEQNFILHAAGNIKYIFDNKEDCEKVVREFPKFVMTFAPGITISQAVVEYENGIVENFSVAVTVLENRLRIQRNKPFRSMTLGLMGIRRSRQTGLPAIEHIVKNNEELFLDKATKSKREAADTLGLCRKAFFDSVTLKEVAFDMEDIANGENNWIAVIHADGNGLGRIVQQIGKDADKFKRFSELLDRATVQSARDAFSAIKERVNHTIIPIRPIVLGGDDFTVICRADLALDYTSAFIKAFEKNTVSICEYPMTACAGISYIKASYPFYYGYELAEELCKEAKKEAKSLGDPNKPDSCILFHKVQDSFNELYKEIKERELMPVPDVDLQFGPYYLFPKEGRWTVEDLKNVASCLGGKDGNAVKSTVRRWLTALYDSPDFAIQLLQRAKLLYGHTHQGAILEKITQQINGRCPAYDILVINTINTQVTK